MKSVTFIGTRSDVQSQAAEWKMANQQFRVVADCRPAAVIDASQGPRPSSDDPVWEGSIYYEESSSN